MSDFCHVCGPNKQECQTVICAPCALCGAPPTLEHGHRTSQVTIRPFLWFGTVLLKPDPNSPGRFIIAFMGQANG